MSDTAYDPRPMLDDELAYCDKVARRCKIPNVEKTAEQVQKDTTLAAMMMTPLLNEVHRLRAEEDRLTAEVDRLYRGIQGLRVPENKSARSLSPTEKAV